jgi:hypothetical protein
MKVNRISETSLDKLLSQLEEKLDEQVGLIVLRGRALSRSTENLHVATRAGIVAVPLKNIRRVSSLSNTQHDVVELLVTDPAQIQPLLRVRPFEPFPTSDRPATMESETAGEGVPADNEFRYWGVGVSTCVSTDTATASGADGALDQTDDVDEHCQADDTDE